MPIISTKPVIKVTYLVVDSDGTVVSNHPKEVEAELTVDGFIQALNDLLEARDSLDLSDNDVQILMKTGNILSLGNVQASTLGIQSQYQFPTTAGSQGQVLAYQGTAQTEWITVSGGFQGRQGFQGSGFQGYQGNQGTGLQGNQGNQGSGFQGYQGNQGTGLQGNQGNQGSGFQGYQGNQGTGLQGNQGFQGSGFQGTGLQGFQGYQGRQGFQGTGFQGTGFQGYQGNQGTGLQGNQGFQGQKAAILPVLGPQGEEYVELICVEMPEVRFEDLVVISMGNQGQNNHCLSKPIDPYFIQVCEYNSIRAISAMPSVPVQVGAYVENGMLNVSIQGQQIEYQRIEVIVKLSGVRRGVAGRRFAQHTKEDMIKNNNFWDQWKS